jgi:hypothetical protein
MNEYFDRVGDPATKTREDLNISLLAIERVAAPFYEWYYDAPEGSEHEAWLLSRIKSMSDYHIACLNELAKRQETGSDVTPTRAIITAQLKKEKEARHG